MVLKFILPRVSMPLDAHGLALALMPQGRYLAKGADHKLVQMPSFAHFLENENCNN